MARGTVARAALLLALFAFGCDTISVRERDDTAGLNGGFEITRNGLPVNWYFYRAPLEDGSAQVRVETADRVEGMRSLRLDVQSVDTAARARLTGFFQVVPAQAGRTYLVSLWLKNPEAPIRLILRSERPQDASDPMIADLPPNADWQPYEYTWTVPPEYENLRIEMQPLGPGTFLLDDVRID